MRGFEDVVGPIALALEQERRVSEQINALAATARDKFTEGSASVRPVHTPPSRPDRLQRGQAVRRRVTFRRERERDRPRHG
jgi:hypothetical protein